MNKTDNRSIEVELNRLIHHINFLIQRVRTRELAKYGLTSARAAVLYILKTSNGKTIPSVIAARIFRSRSSITELLTRMENEGLITRTKEKGRNKNIMIGLTKKGEIAEDLSNSTNDLDNIFATLPAKKQLDLHATLTLVKNKLLEREGFSDDSEST
jgi:MarR family transcriptional regulator, organic hydroperoxide resistance regulator